MAYSGAQRRRHIAELQKYLYVISLFNGNIPQIMVDGVFGDETREAVRIFRREYDLEETGDADIHTWNKAVSVYKELISGEPQGCKAFPSRKHIIKPGDCGALVTIIQAMLNEAAQKFDNLPCLKISGKYDNDTICAVKAFCNCTGLPQSECFDCRTWNTLVKFCEHMNKIG